MMKKIALTLAVLAASSMAGNASGTIHGVTVTANGIILFDVLGSQTGVPACSSTKRYSVDTNTQPGKAMYSLILQAKAAGRPVYLVGTGTCTLWGDTETTDWVKMTD